jgi:predicted GNAT family acetyltransferase
MSDIKVTHNDSKKQFEADVAGGTALVAYEKKGDEIRFLHTEVPEQAAGKGVAQALVRNALDYAREKKLVVVPECSYVASFVKRNRNYDDIIHPDYLNE